MWKKKSQLASRFKFFKLLNINILIPADFKSFNKFLLALICQTLLYVVGTYSEVKQATTKSLPCGYIQIVGRLKIDKHTMVEVLW